MKVWILILAIMTWIVCGVVAYGIALAYYQRKYPNMAKADYLGDVIISMVIGLLGLPALFSVFLLSRFAKYGIKFR